MIWIGDWQDTYNNQLGFQLQRTVIRRKSLRDCVVEREKCAPRRFPPKRRDSPWLFTCSSHVRTQHDPHEYIYIRGLQIICSSPACASVSVRPPLNYKMKKNYNTKWWWSHPRAVGPLKVIRTARHQCHLRLRPIGRCTITSANNTTGAAAAATAASRW